MPSKNISALGTIEADEQLYFAITGQKISMKNRTKPEREKLIIDAVQDYTSHDHGGGQVVDLTPFMKYAVYDGLDNFAALRTRAPVREGERINIKGHTTAPYGGGEFIGHIGTATDDGGYTAAGSGFYWRRNKPDLDTVDVCDFGAIPDGVTDASAACTAMLMFTMSAPALAIAGNSTIAQSGIKFPAGTFYVKPVDWRKFGAKLGSSDSDLPYYPSGYAAHGGIRIQGAYTEFGKQIFTKIISDKSTSPVFYINHRRMYVAGIAWDGQQTVKPSETTFAMPGSTLAQPNLAASNKQPFLRNECPGGLFSRIKCFSAANTGDYTFYVLDTLDSKWDQIYSQYTAGPVFQVGWSNRVAGAWDHSTAIELTNFNFQYCMAPSLWAPRATQCLMRNGWVEHSSVPWDLNNGNWLMEEVSIESSTYNGMMWMCRTQVHGMSGPTGNSLDFKTGPSSSSWPSYTTNPDGSAITEWLTYFERGQMRLEHFGAEINGSLKAKWHSGLLRGVNNANAIQWVNIGVITMPNVGDMWEFEIISTAGYTSVGSGNYPVISDRTPGKTFIRIQRGSGATPVVTFYHEGVTGVQAVQYGTQTSNDILPSLWVRFSPYCGGWVINAKSTGPSRFDAGTCTRLEVDGTIQTTAPGLNVAVNRFGIHNGAAGFGAQGSNVAIQTATGTPTSTTAPAGYLAIVGPAGTIIYIPYFT